MSTGVHMEVKRRIIVLPYPVSTPILHSPIIVEM
jgi:hypothetical protein